MAEIKLEGIANTKTICGDANEILLPRKKYDVVMCVSALHHIVELEHLMDQVSGSLKDDVGEFWSVGEYVGRNGARLWSEVYKIANPIFQALPEKYRINNLAADRRVEENLSDIDCSAT